MTRVLLRKFIAVCGKAGKSCHSKMSSGVGLELEGRVIGTYLSVQPYDAPTWAKESGIKNIPKGRLLLAQPNTPIHKWDLPGVPEGFEVFIKRDDMTGSTLSGNKVRKLEFLMADAVEKGCKHVITVGGIQSNHCRATALAATQIGMKTHLFLRGDVRNTDEVSSCGNMFLHRMCGARMYFVPKISETKLKPRIDYLIQKIKRDTGEDAYNIPVGGSNTVGFFGYMECIRELETQGALDEFDDLVFACGSGGTMEGLSVGNYLTGSKLRIHGFAASDNAAYFHGHANNMFPDLGLSSLKSEDLCDIVEGYKGQGYGESSQEELNFVANVSCKTGIVLDPVYTGKAVKGMVEELRSNPQRFKGRKILYLHTGGIFGAYDGRLEPTLRMDGAQTNDCHMWMDETKPPV